MRSRFAMLLAIAAVCVTAAWAEWTPEVLVTDGGDAGRTLHFNGARRLVFASDGVGHVIWRGDGGIGCNRYDPLSGWGTDYQIDLTGEQPLPAVALDADGTTIHVIWNDTLVRYRKCTRGVDGSDVWGPIVPVSPMSAPWGELGMASAPNSPGHLVACWARSFTLPRNKSSSAMVFVECVNGVWSTELRLDSAVSVTRLHPTIAVAPNGDVFISYVGKDHNSSGHQVFVKTRHNGVWGATVDVTQTWAADHSVHPAIEVDPYTGNPHVVFDWWKAVQVSKKVSYMISGVLHTYRNSQGTWPTTPDTISVPRQIGGATEQTHGPTIAFASDGAALAFWFEYSLTQDHGVMYSYCSNEGSTWSDPAWLTSDPSGDYWDEFPHAAVDEAADAIHVVWGRYLPGHGSTSQIWWRSNSLGGDGPHALPMTLPQARVELFPNPVRAGRVTVEYALPHEGPMTVTLLDVSGRAVHRSSFVVRRSGAGSFALDASGLRAGVYVLKLDVGTTSQTRKVVIE